MRFKARLQYIILKVETIPRITILKCYNLNHSRSWGDYNHDYANVGYRILKKDLEKL